MLNSFCVNRNVRTIFNCFSLVLPYYHLWTQNIYCLSKIIPITFPAFQVFSVDDLCVNLNAYSQGIHAAISKEVTCKTLKSMQNLLWATFIYYGNTKFIAL